MSGLSKNQRGRLTMFLLTPDLIEEWNQAVRVRHAFFQIDYKTHWPTLLIGSEHHEPEIWQTIDTRRRAVLHNRLLPSDLALVVDDIQRRLAKHEAVLQFRWDKNKQKQQRAILQFAAAGGANVTSVLITAKKGTISEPFGQFGLTEKW